MEREIYVIGHKNPDCDSVVSAIALANLKRNLGYNCYPAVLSDINDETRYLLSRFKVKIPKMLYSARCMLKDIDYDQAILVSADITMKEALDKSLSMKNKGVIVVDDDKHLLGVVSMSDLTSLWTFDEKVLSSLMSKVKFGNIVKTLKGKIYYEHVSFKTSGIIQLLPSLTNSMAIGQDSIVIVGNNPDVQRSIIANGASLMIIAGEDWIDGVTLDIAIKHGVSVMYTPYSAMKVSQMIFQSTSIKEIMTNEVISFKNNEYVEDVVAKMAKTRFRMYPLLDEDEHVIGSISRYHLFNYAKKQFILVDHNEYSQSIKDLNYGEILEIVDHHRLGGIKTESPINVTSLQVGSCATIVTKMYLDEGVDIPDDMASILLGAIISDTLCLKSPTTKPLDHKMAKMLSEKVKITLEDLAQKMIEANDSILKKSYLDLLYSDFKEFRQDGKKFAIGQCSCRFYEDYQKIKDGFAKYLEEVASHQEYDLILYMFTDPLGKGSYLLSVGKYAQMILEGFEDMDELGFVKAIISRKQQVLPIVVSLLKE
ncbi:MAG: putative manganese-dependent inorganic diphosphatase [Erysipelotrichaceae bacterium]|nr:putative manganese-dependent inorganic diphosphatase [Erysipelotrichaceae bacterium]MDY5252404.1 putative manganese-dependent inorganic diphosphatase [Erysipelotrichaceae bacterium]